MPGEPLVDPRVALAAALLTGAGIVSAALDRKRRGPAATKGAEYARLAALGLAGAIFGAAVDAVTSAHAPEYFTLGKGLADDGLFRLRALAHGAQAGFAAGMVAGAALLFAANPKGDRPPPPVRRLATGAATALGLATLGGLIATAIPALTLPAGLRAELTRVLAAEAFTRFETVWRAHVGVYAGAALGLVLAIRQVRAPKMP